MLAKKTSPKKSEKSPQNHRHGQIPRTLNLAKKLKYQIMDTKFSDWNEEMKANFVEFSDQGMRKGSYCGMSPSSMDPNFYMVCYKGADGKCIYVHVPKGQPIADHI